MKYSHVLISAENVEQANTILDALLEKKIIFGGPVLQGPAKFWWKGEICEMNYAYILTYTREDLVEQMTTEAEQASSEEVCMISCMPMEANDALIKLLDATFTD
jgi:uncharacterized protein involved in tolerance to divalent cations